MPIMILGLALWWATQLFKIKRPEARAALDRRIGKGAARGLMTVLTLAAVALMVIGYQRADFVNLWYPPAFMVHINNLLMLLAVFFFIAGGIPSPVRTRIRHPQLIGTKTWAVAHLLVNGDLASVVLFGGILAWAVVAMVGINRRDGAEWERPPVRSAARGWTLHVIGTLVVFGVIAVLHFYAGVSPFPGAAA